MACALNIFRARLDHHGKSSLFRVAQKSKLKTRKVVATDFCTEKSVFRTLPTNYFPGQNALFFFFSSHLLSSTITIDAASIAEITSQRYFIEEDSRPDTLAECYVEDSTGLSSYIGHREIHSFSRERGQAGITRHKSAMPCFAV